MENDLSIGKAKRHLSFDKQRIYKEKDSFGSSFVKKPLKLSFFYVIFNKHVFSGACI